MMMMAGVGMSGSSCLVVLAVLAAVFYLNQKPGGLGGLGGNTTPLVLGSSTGVGSKGPDEATGLKSSVNKYKVDLGASAKLYMQAISGAYPFMYQRRGGAGKRCNYVNDIQGAAKKEGQGAAADPGVKPDWAIWNFTKTADAGKPSYTISSAGRVTEKCGDNVLAPADLTACGSVGADHIGSLRLYSPAQVPTAFSSWVVYRDGRNNPACVLEHQGCKSIAKMNNRYLYFDAAQAAEGRYAWLTTWDQATRFWMSPAA